MDDHLAEWFLSCMSVNKLLTLGAIIILLFQTICITMVTGSHHHGNRFIFPYYLCKYLLLCIHL